MRFPLHNLREINAHLVENARACLFKCARACPNDLWIMILTSSLSLSRGRDTLFKEQKMVGKEIQVGQ